MNSSIINSSELSYTKNKSNSNLSLFNGYKRIKVVGKGAFGTAVLFRKPDGDTVVIKEVNLNDLLPDEKIMALNEVNVLASLSHPNIISYYGSVEHDNVLMIEMEYADGGTLSQLLAEKEKRLPERNILEIFQQIVTAIDYMHQHNVLHRDLKTANVFLNKTGSVKIGDFGISKMLTTKACAQTVLGTPYYMSPEMCEGKDYAEKSDMWALGCILYEMATYQKPFVATSLPALVKNIMEGQFSPLPNGYSYELGQLVGALLQVNPELRASSYEVLNHILPKVYNNLGDRGYDISEEATIPTASTVDISSVDNIYERSVLYQLKAFQNETSLTPIQLPPTIQISCIAVSSTHFIAVTTDGLVYTWGENRFGQLGHDDIDSWRHFPQCVEMVRNRHIKSAAAGEGFSIFLDDAGDVLTCGDGSLGCLGHGTFKNELEPKPILNFQAKIIKCSFHHVVALSYENVLYTWGKGEYGALGQDDEQNCCLPKKITIGDIYEIDSIFCGFQTTAAITTDGKLLVCGCNSYNKLGVKLKDNKLNEKIFKMTIVTNITQKVTYISLGVNHTALIVQGGYVLMLGQNNNAQLGLGHNKAVNNEAPYLVTSLADRFITMVECGPSYTVVSCDEQCLTLWGTRYGSIVENSDNLFQTKEHDPGNTTSVFTNYLTAFHHPEILFHPVDILALYSSESQISMNKTLSIGGFYPMEHSILVLVHTTAPLNKNFT